MSSPQPTPRTASDTEHPAEPVDNTATMVGFLWTAIVIQAAGAVLTLLPPHWTTAGIIIAGFGTLLCSAFANTRNFTVFDPGSPQRATGHKSARIAIAYGTLAAAGGITAAVLPPHYVASGVTISVMGLIPFALGIRQFCAFYDKHPIRYASALWTHRVAVAVVFVLLLVHVAIGIGGGTNNWLTAVGITFGVPLTAVSLVSTTRLRGHPIAVTTLAISLAPLAVIALTCVPTAWLTVLGNPPQSCTYVGTQAHSSRTNTTYSYQYQCGTERLRYKPNQTVTPVEGDSLTLVTDSAGIVQPLQPQEIPGARGVVGLAGFAVSATALLAASIRHRNGRQRKIPVTGTEE